MTSEFDQGDTGTMEIGMNYKIYEVKLEVKVTILSSKSI